MEFNHQKIEKKWQNFWEKKAIYKTDLFSDKKKFYALDMFPYPSGFGLHVGHPRGYTATDAIARFKKMKGYEVFHPMGWDAFGLPAEQYAIQTGNNPREFTKKNIAFFKKQLKSFGYSFDWKFEINTSKSKYYHWTQWIFSEMFKKGLAVLKDIEVNWSPSLNIVLANEEVIIDRNGNSVAERNGFPVEKRRMKQWVLKITTYAERLFSGLEQLNWPESVKKLQKNWIYLSDDQGNYTKELHLKDWIFARQRYWGEPFPVIYLENGEIYLLPNELLPVKLPKIDNYQFSENGLPPLSRAKKWSEVKIDTKKGIRDWNVMPQWAGSSWYYLAYLLKSEDGYLPLNSKKAKTILNKWLPIDLYIGGQEHAVLHLLYARFWHLFLYDQKLFDVKEPFARLFNQGMILGENRIKMSKSKGNVINPQSIIEDYGVDALRLYEMFMGGLEEDKSWEQKQLVAARNWLDRVFRLFTKHLEYVDSNKISDETKFHFNILLTNIENHFEKLKFNVAISEMMIFVNKLFKEEQISFEITIAFLQILSCICPHISEEISHIISKSEKETKYLPLYLRNWPKKFKITNKIQEKKEIVLQINGKIRGRLQGKIIDLNALTSKELHQLLIKIAPKYIDQKTQFKKIIIVNANLISVKI